MITWFEAAGHAHALAHRSQYRTARSDRLLPGGHSSCSLESARRRVQDAPSAVLGRLVMADSLSAWDRHEQALREVRRAAAVNPVNSDIPGSLATQFLLLHRPREAIEAIRSAPDGTPRDLVSAVASMQMGRREESTATVSRLEAKYGQARGPFAVSLAELHAALGEPRAAVNWLLRALARDEGDLNYIKLIFAPYPQGSRRPAASAAYTGVPSDRRTHYNPAMPNPSRPVTLSGRCLCRAVCFVAQGPPNWVAHCHCESCRRATSSPFTTYVGYQTERVSWSGTAAATHQSSPGVVRSFCPRCGSPMSFASDRWPNEIHLFVSCFEKPAIFSPQLHVHAGEQLPWVVLKDRLPRYALTPRHGPPLK